ncbi:MAG: hypothetical protein RBG13Loki_0775 [Promethearchaeota archaeon CR_4]|nr:MAG: hypothetical protein RBG13Loki_0775 [Candidatus Lokiarchaeota archaeon CR_4]
MSLLRWYDAGKEKDVRIFQRVKIRIDGQIPQASARNPGASVPVKPVRGKWEGSIETHWVFDPVGVSFNMAATHLRHRTFTMVGGAFRVKGASIGDIIFDLRSIQ